jgi:hypothetical protein
MPDSYTRYIPLAVGDKQRGNPAISDCEYTNEELDLLRAIQKFKEDHHKPFPTCCDLLKVIKSLGYRLVMPPCSIDEVR